MLLMLSSFAAVFIVVFLQNDLKKFVILLSSMLKMDALSRSSSPNIRKGVKIKAIKSHHSTLLSYFQNRRILDPSSLRRMARHFFHVSHLNYKININIEIMTRDYQTQNPDCKLITEDH